MILYICGHDFHYEMENLCRVFFPNEKITVSDTLPESGAPEVETYLDGASGGYSVRVRVNVGDKTETRSAEVPKTDEPEKDECERTMARELFSALSAVTGYVPPWGILTGVRPSKLMLKLIESLGEKGAYDYFTKKLLVSEPKARLAQSVAGTEQEIAALGDERSFSLYIAIPFCPSRCSYCSFVSHSIEKAGKLMEAYLDTLCGEIIHTGEILKQAGLRIVTIYIGGGTPTTLSAEQMDRLLHTVHQSLDLRALEEFTVEAGRPDTITREKLTVLKKYGVDRISINPQSMNDAVLEGIGRHHSAQDVLDRYQTAREVGFSAINMDTIAGLDGDTPESFARTIDMLLELNPENITVHTLAAKRGADQHDRAHNAQKQDDVRQMLEIASQKLTAAGYVPYYLYRQKFMAGGFENVGWCKIGYECKYNVYMMEELQTIVSLGAGGVTKLLGTDGRKIRRISNPKYPYEYNVSLQRINAGKQEILNWAQSRTALPN